MNARTEDTLSFFDRNTEERPEIVQGLIREGDFVVFAGNYGMGKSPTLADLTVHLIHGLTWCGRKVAQRPVVVIDFESPEPDYKNSIRRIAARLELPTPNVPRDLVVFLQNARNDPGTARLLEAIAARDKQAKVAFLESELREKPNAVVIIDPLSLYFTINWIKPHEVVGAYGDLRLIIHKYPHSAIVGTFNLRKRDRKNGRADLLSDPREWLEEVSGSLDILNRSDVRLGIEKHHDDVRVINGIVRGREMHPLLIHPVRDRDDQLAGFEQVIPEQSDLLIAMTVKQKQHWDNLPSDFRFEQVADKIVPRASLSRLVEKAEHVGALKKSEEGVYRKQCGGGL